MAQTGGGERICGSRVAIVSPSFVLLMLMLLLVSPVGCLRHRCSPPPLPPRRPSMLGCRLYRCVMTVHDFISMTL